MKVLIVTVAYNPTIEITNILNIENFSHLVIDNSDIENLWLRNFCIERNYHYLPLGGNKGIAEALNKGAEFAIKLGCDYIITMDQDSKLTKYILQQMINFINGYVDTTKVAIFSPRHINPSDKYIKHSEEYSNDIFTMTSGNFLNLKIWESLKGFNSKLFIDLVDFDYNARAILAGFKVLTINTIEMHQYVGENATTKWIGKYGFDVWHHGKIRKYYQARNYNYIYKQYKNQLPEAKLLKKIIRKMPISIIFFEKNKLSKLLYYFLGVVDYYRGKLGKFNWW